MKKLVILGSTGSIGRNTLEIIRRYPENFKVIGLAAGSNLAMLAKQVQEFKPEYAALYDHKKHTALKNRLPGTEILSGEQGLKDMACIPQADIIVSAISGIHGLIPTYAAAQAGKNIALANKESLVLAGHLILANIKKNKAVLTPVDSEHSAVWNLLKHTNTKKVREIVLTASGGPFLHRKTDTFTSITIKNALTHPTWNMGAKITIDSATMMNKGFEVIEAHHLFGFPYDKIKVVIHPESVIHSLIHSTDGSYYAQLAPPDMKLPILSALDPSGKLENNFSKFDLTKLGGLTFLKPDLKKFPLLKLAYTAGKEGGILPAVLAAADDMAVQKFLNKEIAFTDIYRLTNRALNKYAKQNIKAPSLETILEVTQEITKQ